MSDIESQAPDQVAETPPSTARSGRPSVPKWESDTRERVKTTVRRLFFVLTLATLIGIAGNSGSLPRATASLSPAAPLAAVAVILQADAGCSRLVGKVGTGSVSLSYSSLFDSYSGTVAGQRVSVSYSSLFDSYSGTVAGQRVSVSYSSLFDSYSGSVAGQRMNMSYSSLFSSYSGTVGRDRIRISHNSLSDSFSGSIGPHRVSLRCS